VTPDRGIGLRLVLAGLALAIIAPVALVAALIVGNSFNEQLDRIERQNIEMARAVSIAIDQEVQNTTTALSLIAALELFDSTALNGFEELVHRVVPRQSGWHAMLLADSEGHTLVITTAEESGDPRQASPEWPLPVLATAKPNVSNVMTHAGDGDHFVIVSVPVLRENQVRYVLGAEVRSQSFTSVLQQQQTPSTGVITLLDRSKRILARTRNEERYIGGLPSPSFLKATNETLEGAWRDDVLLEGTPAYGALSTSSKTGWTVGVGLPADEVERRNLWLLLGVSIAALSAAGGLAAWFTRAFERSINAASRTAMALARGESAVIPRSRVREVNVLAGGLRLAADTLQARMKERDEAERLKDEFLMTLSHELRTPLTAIAGWSHMLATGQMREGQQMRAIASIERNSMSLTQLVDDLLDVSRSISGKLRVDVQPVDVPSVVQAAVDAVRPAADAKDIRIEIDFDQTRTTVLGDGNRLRQVVWNLLSNAVKFTPNGGSVRVRTRVVNDGDDESAAESALEVSVSDTGPGIDPQFMPFISIPAGRGRPRPSPWRPRPRARHRPPARGAARRHGGGREQPGRGRHFPCAAADEGKRARDATGGCAKRFRAPGIRVYPARRRQRPRRG
jgi:signal transduction histidine kinase